jgi:nucleolar GTP-binding protein
MNTIEMQSITAVAHLRSAILYFMDLSEQCGYSVTDQIKLYHSIKPLFANKIVFIVINKIDVRRPEDLDPEQQEELQNILRADDVELLQASCTTTEGVSAVKNAACDKLLAERVAQKLKSGSNTAADTPGGRLGDVLARIHVARPMNGVVRETFIPEAVKNLKKYDKNDPNRRTLERDLEEENGGAGVYSFDMQRDYTLANPEWNHDKIPEVWNGKNIYDFVDPDIETKLAALEEEEEKMQADGYYDSDESVEDAEDADNRMKANLIREKRVLMKNDAKMRKSLKNRAPIPRSAKSKRLSQMQRALDSAGYDVDAAGDRARAQSQGRGRTSIRREENDDDAMDLDDPHKALARAKSRARSQPATDRRHDGVTSFGSKDKAERMMKLGQKQMNLMARAGEADRHTPVSLPKHLVCSLILSSFPDISSNTFSNSSPESAVWARPSAVKGPSPTAATATGDESRPILNHRQIGFHTGCTMVSGVCVLIFDYVSRVIIPIMTRLFFIPPRFWVRGVYVVFCE